MQLFNLKLIALTLSDCCNIVNRQDDMNNLFAYKNQSTVKVCGGGIDCFSFFFQKKIFKKHFSFFLERVAQTIDCQKF